jgi:hypothetical protein
MFKFPLDIDINLSIIPPTDFSLNQIMNELENIYKFKDLMLAA